jgi:hypothetical protein
MKYSRKRGGRGTPNKSIGEWLGRVITDFVKGPLAGDSDFTKDYARSILLSENDCDGEKNKIASDQTGF